MSEDSQVSGKLLEAATIVIIEITTISGDVPTELEMEALKDAARSADEVIRASKRCMICISGYDDDPRAIDQIPEARRGVIGFWEQFQPYYERMGVKRAFTGLVKSNIPILVLGCAASEGKVGWVKWRSDGLREVELDPTDSILNLSAAVVQYYEALGHMAVPDEHAEELWKKSVLKSGVKYDPTSKTRMRTRH